VSCCEPLLAGATASRWSVAADNQHIMTRALGCEQEQ